MTSPKTVFLRFAEHHAPSERWISTFPAHQQFTWPCDLSMLAAETVVWVCADSETSLSHLSELLRQMPVLRVVAMSYQSTEQQALEVLKCGARGYCHALSPPVALREIAAVVECGGFWIGETVMGRVLQAAASVLLPETSQQSALFARLSPREQEVTRVVLRGLSNKEVALQLGIQERTVKAHLSAVFLKLDVRDRLQLVLKFAENGG